MSEWRHVSVRVVRDDFAAEVTGLDLRCTLPEETLAEVRAVWAAFPVLCFPDQALTVDELEAFSLQIGPFGVDPFVAPMEAHPNVLEVRRGPDEQGIIFGAAWHSDWSFQERPPSATLLHSQIVPPVGGDTLYVDCRKAWATLSDDLKQIARENKAVHSARLAYGTTGRLATDPQPREMKILTGEKAHATQLHPMVRTHPVTGRSALFVNPVYTIGIEGMGEADGQALLARFYQHLFAGDLVHRHRWRQNMLVMWDNRCVVHNAEGGYEGHARLMHRTTVAGERPVRGLSPLPSEDL
jgi:taurine dioxygenase